MTIFLETKRLIIKAPELKDIDKIYMLDSDPDVMRYIGNGLPRSQEQSRSWYEKSIQYYEKYGCSFGLVYEKETGEFVGRAGINHNAYDDSQPDVEIGYRLLKNFWNKGYATELATALIQWGFQNLKVEKICGFAIPDNKASRHVLEKVGMKLIGFDQYAEEEVVRYEIFRSNQKIAQPIYQDFFAAKKWVYEFCEFECSEPILEPESIEYGACSFTINHCSAQFRIAKITPTKPGQFVTLWKRMETGPIQPYDISDPVDFFVISVRNEDRFGQFIFPKSILVEKDIFSVNGKGGKRGIRVYPPWDTALNRQAQKTQEWQIKYFLEIPINGSIDIARAKMLYKM